MADLKYALSNFAASFHKGAGVRTLTSEAILKLTKTANTINDEIAIFQSFKKSSGNESDLRSQCLYNLLRANQEHTAD
jgi:hypothetical protein